MIEGHLLIILVKHIIGKSAYDNLKQKEQKIQFFVDSDLPVFMKKKKEKHCELLIM